MRRRLCLLLAVALATTPGCFALTFDVEKELDTTRWEAGETTTAALANVTHDPGTDALTFVVRDDTTRRSERVDHWEESRSWTVRYLSLTDHVWTEADDDAALFLLIATPITLAFDLCIPIGSLLAAPLRVAFGDGLNDWDERTPEVKVEQQPWAPLELYDPTTGARAPAVDGTRAGDLALNGFRALELTAIGQGGQERPLVLPASVAPVFSEVAAGWDRAPEELRARVPLGSSLADAARRAPEGAWLQLEAGDYRLESTVYLHDRRLTLAGRGAGVTRVHARGVALWISGAAHEVTLRGLTVELDGSTVSDGVRASGGRTILQGCAITGARFEEVPPPPPEPPAPGEAPKPPAGPSYRGGVGLHLDGEGYTEVRASAFAGNGTMGILVADGHRLHVSGSRFDGAKLEGVSFRGGSKENLVSGCTVRGPGHGVGVFGTSGVSVQTTDIQVTRAGILVDREANVFASRNTPHGCASGISVQGKATGTVADNTCEGNGAGILVETDGTHVVVTGNTCRNNSNNGITLQGKSSVDARGNTCTGNKTGILVSGSTQGTVSDNTLESNDCGLAYQDQGAAGAHGNRLRNNTTMGLMISGTSSPRVYANEIRSNRRGGVMLQGTSGSAWINDNDIADNGGNGIQVGAGLSPSIELNRIANNSGSGVIGAPGVFFTAPGNTFTSNGDQR